MAEGQEFERESLLTDASTVGPVKKALCNWHRHFMTCMSDSVGTVVLRWGGLTC